ncbi:transglycosylase SLT domain-containing protein [Pediococcus pentosaceus]|uniref:lytic transglycosylase domain-containing protein n=1 Tax=Pediococcus pentosaceus TaxID=1255 RepID=UPI003BF8E4D3
MSKLGLSTSTSMVSRVLRQINTESGGNPKAMGGTDGLSDGHAEGLMQVKPPTFKAYHLPGHNNIWNGYDNILAGLNYAKHRYGSGLSFLGNGHGYANGGIANTPSIFGEAGPEMAIPLSMTRSDRANQLLGETVVHMAKNNPDRLANGGNYLTGSHDLTEIKALLKDTIGKLDEVVQAVYNTALTDQSIHNANKRETDKVNYLSNLGKGLI